MPEQKPRTRAWILIQANSPQEAAQELYETVRDEGDESYVIIRADVVDYVYNVVIPVDAASPAGLEEARLRILEVTGAKEFVVLPVRQTFPAVPHDAHGFITEHEAAHGHESVPHPGRQHWSPGQNAWG